MLVQDMLRTSIALITKKIGGMTDVQITETYTRLCLEVKLRASVRFLTERDKGGVGLG